MNRLGLYIHIPFCIKKCSYCDFLSFEHSDPEYHEAYVNQLCNEIVERGMFFANPTVDSLFIGGGTPSILCEEHVESILDACYSCFRVEDDAEITLECNPGTLEKHKLSFYRSIGVNRISMGAQSFNEEKLKLLGRIHDTQDILFGYDMIREAGFNNVSLDLIFGTPSESPETWADDISRAILLNPEHISFYSLQLEKDTPLHTDWLLGKFDALSELTDRNMYHFAIDALASAGFEQYEISNSSKPGFESRHNLKYWSMDDYLGMGVSAHSYIKGSRFANTENYTEYLTAGNVMEMTDWIHENSRFDEMSEYIFLGLRKTEGINLNSFDTHFDANFMNMFKDETEALIRRGLLEKNQRTLKLTQLGMDLSNLVFSEYV